MQMFLADCNLNGGCYLDSEYTSTTGEYCLKHNSEAFYKNG